ncbi:hypothetical protein [Foetidibacter luteolus]|uniref:hypothetical protein n=1 Tax=Foetidibacter luteolus TaxID=2608880 RepID=UPI00129A14D1|nr:hypothetical protein [Foetidibacter luteolus]
MKIYLLLLLPWLPAFATAQQDKKLANKISYASSYELGILAGKAYTPFTARIIQGVRYQNYEAGIGVALDPYAFRSVPVFIHVAYHLYNGRNTPYAYGDAGISFPWNNGALPEKYTDPRSGQQGEDWHILHNGVYGEAGIGYKIMLNKRNAFIMNAGYSYKKFKYDEFVNIWNGNESIRIKQGYSFDYNRLVFRLGFTL